MPPFFFFNDTATTEIYTLSLHDALPICRKRWTGLPPSSKGRACAWPKTAWCWCTAARRPPRPAAAAARHRSEEHTSELQSRQYLVCRLLLEKKKTKAKRRSHRGWWCRDY